MNSSHYMHGAAHTDFVGFGTGYPVRSRSAALKLFAKLIKLFLISDVSLERTVAGFKLLSDGEKCCRDCCAPHQ